MSKFPKPVVNNTADGPTMTFRIPVESGMRVETRSAGGERIHESLPGDTIVFTVAAAVTGFDLNLEGLGLSPEVQGMLHDQLMRLITIQTFAARIAL